MASSELFVSFVGHKNGVFSQGWTVGSVEPLVTGADIDRMCRELEQQRGFDAGSVCIISFQRLEQADD